MTGTFRFGDLLIIEYSSLTDIHPGDVVVYRALNNKGNKKELVHRVMRMLPEGLIVRGDRNLHADITLATKDNLVGRVRHVRRNGKDIPVRNGLPGLLRARTGHGYRRLREWIWGLARFTGRMFYARLRDSGLVGHLWRPSIERVRLTTDEGPLVKYLHRNRTVARYWSGNGHFECRKPYDLLLRRNEQKRP